MVDHQTDADAGRRIDVDGENPAGLALEVEREVGAALLPERMREAMGHERMESLEVQKRLDVTRAGRVPVVDGGEIGAEGRAQLRPALQHLGEGLSNQPGVHIGVVETLCEAMTDRIFEPFMRQDGGVDEPAQRAFGHGHGFRFLADRRPDRIDRPQTAPRSLLRCGHVWSPNPTRLSILQPERAVTRVAAQSLASK